MLVFIFNDVDGVCVGSVDHEVIVDAGLMIDDVAKLSSGKYFIVDADQLPSEPQEAWVLSDDGEITIDQNKLIQIKREQMPSLTPIEFDLKLAEFELYNEVQDLIATDLSLKIAYTRATFFSRTDPFIDQARIALGLTDEQVDAMWMR